MNSHLHASMCLSRLYPCRPMLKQQAPLALQTSTVFFNELTLSPGYKSQKIGTVLATLKTHNLYLLDQYKILF